MQGTGSFADLTNSMINDNSALTGSTFHLDDDHLRIQLELAMDPLLSSEIDNNKKITAKKDLDTWVDLVIIIDERHTCEKEMRKVEAEEAT